MPPIMANSKDGQGHKDKFLDTNRKGPITENIHVKYQSSSTRFLKFISKVKVFKKGSNSKIKVTRSKIIVTTERSYHREYSCEISKL